MVRILPITLTLLSTPALAWRDYSDDCGGGTAPTWASGGVTMAISNISFPTAADRAEVEDAINTWDDAQIPGTDFEATHSVTGVSSTSNNDGINIIGFAEVTEYGCAGWPGPIGITDINLDGCGWFGTPRIVEADMLLNCSYDWEADGAWYDEHDGTGFNPYPWDVGQIVVHEMGHVVGLDDLYGPGFSAAMEGNVSGGWGLGDNGYLSSDQFQSSEDDHEGVRTLYPDGSNNGDDVALQSFVYFEDGETYDDYCLSDMTRASPYHDLSAMAVEEGLDPEDCPDTVPSGPTELYEIYEAASMDVTFQAVNNGDTDRSVDLVIYLASDDTDRSTWVEIHASTPTLNVNTPYALTRRVTIPSGTSTGWYYIIAEIDPDDTLSEVREDNNLAVWKRPLWVEALPECSCSGTGGRPAGALLLAAALLARKRRR